MKNKKSVYFIVFLILSISLLLLTFFAMDSDYLWHIKAGEYMVNNGLLTKDVFSWSVYSKYWMSHEWLFEVIIYGLKCLFGNYHLFVYCFVTIFSLLLILFFSNRENYLKNISFTLIWLVLSFILCTFVQGRPHLISFCLLAITMYLLFSLYKDENSKKIYFLPLVSVVWANVHGGSSNLVYILCFVFIITGVFSFKFSKIEAKKISKLQLKKYLIVMILCMIGICINIHGFKMLIYPYQNMMDSLMVSSISEWRETSLNEAYDYVFYGFVLLNILILLFSKKKINFLDFILFLLFTYLGLKAIRFWAYLYIVMSFIIFNYVDKRELDRGTNVGIGVVGCLFIVLFIARSNCIFNISYKSSLSEETINFIKSENPKRLFNWYDYGGDLIYNDIKVFVDGRADLYSKYNLNDYFDIVCLDDNYDDLIREYDFDYFLIPYDSNLRLILSKDKSYGVVYKENDIILYKKRS